MIGKGQERERLGIDFLQKEAMNSVPSSAIDIIFVFETTQCFSALDRPYKHRLFE